MSVDEIQDVKDYALWNKGLHAMKSGLDIRHCDTYFPTDGAKFGTAAGAAVLVRGINFEMI